MSLLLVVAIAAFVPAQTQTRGNEGRFTLSGQVVDAASGQPLAGVDLTLQTSQREPAGQPAAADAQGRFAFRNLAAGKYILSAEGAFGTVNYGDLPEPGRFQTIRLGAEKGDRTVVFRIQPRGTIEGTVRDQFGDPAASISVSLLRPIWSDGRTTFLTLGQKSTDDRGRYRFGNLAPGGYIVCSGAGPGNPLAAATPGPVDFSASAMVRYYARTCNPASLTPLQLAPGRHAQVDVDLLTTTAVSVRGRVIGAPPGTGVNPTLMGVDAEGRIGSQFAWFAQSLDPQQGTFIFRGVPPGRYVLSANLRASQAGGPMKTLTARTQVDVGSSDVDGLQLPLEADGAVDVVFEGAEVNHADSDNVHLYFMAKESADARRFAGDPDDAMHYAMEPGSYWIVARGTASACVDSIKMGDQEMGDSVTVTSAKTIRLRATVSAKCGEILARTVQDGAPAPSAKIVLLRSGTAKNPGDLTQEYSGDDGEFVFEGLKPGRYLLWAWKADASGIAAGPTSLAEVEQQATVVDVEYGEPAKIDVPLLKGGK